MLAVTRVRLALARRGGARELHKLTTELHVILRHDFTHLGAHPLG